MCDYYYDPVPVAPPSILVGCKDVQTAALLAKQLPSNFTTTYPGNIPTAQNCDIGWMTFEPMTQFDQTWFHLRFRAHLKHNPEITFTA